MLNWARCLKILANFRSSFCVILLFFVLAIAVDLGLSHMLARQFRLDQEVFVTLELGALRARLEKKVNTNLFLVSGMAANITVRPQIPSSDFDALARVLISQSNVLKNIAAAPNFVIRNMYPLV